MAFSQKQRWPCPSEKGLVPGRPLSLWAEFQVPSWPVWVGPVTWGIPSHFPAGLTQGPENLSHPP